MKVVVTGGTGLIGRKLHRSLIQSGHEVALLTRPDWDGERDIAPADIVRGADAVIHLAGENIAAKRWTSDRKKHLCLSRILSAKNLREGLRRADTRPKIFMTASAVGIYGDRGDEELNENSTTGNDFLAGLCREWEAASENAAPLTVKLRFGVVISRDGGFLEKTSKIFKRVGASRLGNGRQWFSWIHIDDLVAAILWILEQQNVSGAVNVVAPHAVTNAQLTHEMRLALKTFQAPPIPGFILKPLLGELAAALLSSQRVVPLKLEHCGFKWKYPTLNYALLEATSATS